MNAVSSLRSEAESLFSSLTHQSEQITVKVSGKVSFAGIFTHTRELHVNPLLLITPDDLPPHLQVTGLEDPLLKLPQFFNVFKSWLAERFNLPPESLNDFESLLLVHVEWWKSSALFQRTKKFILAHEIAHAYYMHVSIKWEKRWAALFAFPFVALAFLLFSGLECILISLGIYSIALKVFRAIRKYSDQHQEKTADLTALHLTSDFPAAKNFFVGIKQMIQRAENQSTFFNKIIRVLFYPETFLNLEHPSPQVRIQYLKEAALKA